MDMNLTNLMQGMDPDLLDVAGQGVLWGIMVLGVYITFRLLDATDLTVDGSFALGGCVCATLIVGRGMNPVVALVIVILAGMAAGSVTGILYTVLEIPSILTGILTQISLWSISLWIVGGSSNTPLLKSKTIMTMVSSSTGFNQVQASQAIGIVTITLTVVVMYRLFGMEIGSTLRAIGNNEDMMRILEVSTRRTKLLALTFNNGLVGVSGALVCQGQKYADIQMGTGAIVISLAVTVIEEVLFGWFCNFALKPPAAVIGFVIYFIIRAFTTKIGMNPNYTKLLSIIVIILALYIPAAANKWKTYKEYLEGENA